MRMENLSAHIQTAPRTARNLVANASGSESPLIKTRNNRMRGANFDDSKHMDKHDRPYKCAAEGCEKLPGFTYSGGLLRHEREVHGKHGGPKNSYFCPHPTCKRHTGKGFSRQENLNEHLRRVHTSVAPPAVSPNGSNTVTNGNGSSTANLHLDGHAAHQERHHPVQQASSQLAGQKRKRDDSEVIAELKKEVNRLSMENEELRRRLEHNQRQNMHMMQQIEQLQQALEARAIAEAAAAAAAAVAAHSAAAPQNSAPPAPQAQPTTPAATPAQPPPTPSTPAAAAQAPVVQATANTTVATAPTAPAVNPAGTPGSAATPLI